MSYKARNGCDITRVRNCCEGVCDCDEVCDRIYDLLKTGDLILFRSQRWTRNFVYFTHVGMIVDLNGEKFVLELNKKYYKKDIVPGVKLYKLLSRIANFDGKIYIAPINRIEKSSIYKLLNNLNEYYNIKFDKYMFFTLLKNTFKIKNKKRTGMFCSEFIGYILQNIDILDKNYKIDTLFPESILDLKNKNNERIFKGYLRIK